MDKRQPRCFSLLTNRFQLLPVVKLRNTMSNTTAKQPLSLDAPTTPSLLRLFLSDIKRYMVIDVSIEKPTSLNPDEYYSIASDNKSLLWEGELNCSHKPT